MARSIGMTALLVIAYFVLPFTRLADAGYLAAFLAGTALVVAVLAVELRLTFTAPYPRLRVVEALLTLGPLYLVLFAAAHYVVGVLDPDGYSETMTRLDALYFTVATFATVGYGDIAPRSEVARVLTLLQMVGGLVLVGIVARLLMGLAQRRTKWRTDRDEA